MNKVTNFFDSTKNAPENHQKLWKLVQDKIDFDKIDKKTKINDIFISNLFFYYECSELIKSDDSIKDLLSILNVKCYCDQSFYVYKFDRKNINMEDINIEDVIIKYFKNEGSYPLYFWNYNEHIINKISNMSENILFEFMDCWNELKIDDHILTCNNLCINNIYKQLTKLKHTDHIYEKIIELCNNHDSIYGSLIGNKKRNFEPFEIIIPLLVDGNMKVYVAMNSDYIYLFDWAGS